MKKIYTLGITSLLVVIMIPNLVLAVWWNPFTWFSSRQTIEKPHISDSHSVISNTKLEMDQKLKSNVASSTPAKKAVVIKKQVPAVNNPKPDQKSKSNTTPSEEATTSSSLTGTATGGSMTTAAGTLTVISSAPQPDSNIVPFNTMRFPFTNVDLTASSDSDVTVNSITVLRSGVGNDLAIASVVLLDRDTNLQVGLSKTINSNHQAILDTSFVVKAGTTRHMSIAVNRPTTAGTNGGQIIHMNVIAVDAGASTVSGTLPVIGAGMTINETITSTNWDKSLLVTFVSNPTPDSFKTLCNSADKIKIPWMKKVLSPDKTSMVLVPYALSEVMRCERINSPKYTLMAANPDFLRADFDNSDSDSLRIQKINYNDSLKKLLGNGGIFVISSDIVPFIDQSTKHLITVKEDEFWAISSQMLNISNPVEKAKYLINNIGSNWHIELSDSDINSVFGF